MASRVGSETPTSSILSISEAIISNEPKCVPVFLPVGAAVSAKYRGAFCEALIESVAQDFRVRVQLKEKKVHDFILFLGFYYSYYLYTWINFFSIWS